MKSAALNILVYDFECKCISMNYGFQLFSELGRAPGGGNGQPTPVLLPGKSHGQRSLAGCSPRGRKALDMI